MNTDEQDILSILQGKPIEETTFEPQQPELPEKVRMTKGARQKAQAISDAVKKVGEGPFEWYAFMLASRSTNDFLVRDILIANGTEVTSGSLYFDGTAHARAAAEVKKLNEKNGTDYYTIGWIHSHADGKPGHSITDDDNFDQLLNTVSTNTQQRGFRRIDLFEEGLDRLVDGDGISLMGRGDYDALLHFEPQTDDLKRVLKGQGMRTPKVTPELLDGLFGAMRMTSFEPVITGFGYSVVVNDAGDRPYAEIGFVEKTPLKGGTKRPTKLETEVELVAVENDVTVDTAEIEQMVTDRIKFMKPRTFPIHWGKGKHRRHGFEVSVQDHVWTQPGFQNLGNYDPDSKTYRNWEGPTHIVQPGQSSLLIPKRYSSQGILLTDLSNAFFFGSMAYLSRFRSEDVKYSEWLDDVYSELLGHHQWGLIEAINAVGMPEPDGREVTMPRSHLYNTNMLREQLLKSVGDDPKQPHVDFQLAFTFGDQNTAIEKLAPRIIELT